MKQFFSFALLLATSAAIAQGVDRTKPPTPGPAPVINIADPANFTLPNGLKVFVVTNSKLPQVSATLTIERDPILEGDKAGMVNMAGQLMRSGTTKMKKVQLDEAIDFLGGSIASGSTFVAANSLTTNFPKLVELMADVALRPAFPADELENIRTQTLSGIKSSQDRPEAISSNVSNVLMFGKNNPYGEIETEATVKKVEVADVKTYYNTYWKPNIAYLVFVGDISLTQAKKLATQYFGGWAKGNVPKHNYAPIVAPNKTYIAIVDRPSAAQTVISINTPVNLKPGAPDAIAASLTNTILGGGFSSRLNQNLREKHAFTYGASSSLRLDKLVGSFDAGSSGRTEKVDSAIAEYMYELKRIGTTTPADSEITSIKNYMSGGFARRLEDPGTIASYALNIARYNLPKDYYRNYLTNLNAVSAEKIKQTGNQYISSQPMIITLVGNAKGMGDLSKYGEVKYFDSYGNPVTAPVVKKVDAGLSGEAIIKKAAEAYGTEAAIAAVKDISLAGTVNIMGQKLDYAEKHILPGSFSSNVMMAGMSVMKETKKGDLFEKVQQGNNAPIDDVTKEEMASKAAFFEEPYMVKKTGYKYDVKGIEPVEGKDAYAVSITTPLGKTKTCYYDVATGIKVQEVSEVEAGPMGKLTSTTKYLEYKTIDGVKFPVKILIDLGVFKQNIDITDIKINSGLKESDL